MVTMHREIKPDASPGMQVRRTNVVVHVLEGEALIYDAESGNTHRLNSTARFIWEHCDGTHDVRRIAERLGETYEVSLESATEHVERMLSEFREHQLVETANGDSLG